MLLILNYDQMEVMYRRSFHNEADEQVHERNILTALPVLPGDIIIMPYYVHGTSINNTYGWMPGYAMRVLRSTNKWVGAMYHEKWDNLAKTACRKLTVEEIEELDILNRNGVKVQPFPTDYPGLLKLTCVTCSRPFHGKFAHEQDCSGKCREKRLAYDNGQVQHLVTNNALAS